MGFALCNGSNGTPDLRNRFLVGAGDSYNLSDIGGAKEVTLTTVQMPSHTHSGSTNTAGEHSHRFLVRNGEGRGGDVASSYATVGYDNYPWPLSAGAHSHTINLNYTGGSQAHENRPPYYAVYYIMKL